MTDDEMQRKMEFLLEQQARFHADLERQKELSDKEYAKLRQLQAESIRESFVLRESCIDLESTTREHTAQIVELRSSITEQRELVQAQTAQIVELRSSITEQRELAQAQTAQFVDLRFNFTEQRELAQLHTAQIQAHTAEILALDGTFRARAAELAAGQAAFLANYSLLEQALTRLELIVAGHVVDGQAHERRLEG